MVLHQHAPKGQKDALQNSIPARNYVHGRWFDVVLENQLWEFKLLKGDDCGMQQIVPFLASASTEER